MHQHYDKLIRENIIVLHFVVIFLEIASITSIDDDPPKKAFDELSSLSFVIAEAGHYRLSLSHYRSARVIIS